MRTLRSQIDRARRATQVLWVTALLVTVGFYVFAYRPVRRELSELRSQTIAARAELASAEARAKESADAGQDVARLRGRLAVSRKLSAPYEPEQFVRAAAQACERAGLRKLSVQSGVLRRTAPLHELPVLLSFEGNFLNTYTFLQQLDEMPWLTRVKGLRLRQVDAAAGDVAVELSLKAYSSED